MVVNELHLAITQGIALGHARLGSQYGERGWYSRVQIHPVALFTIVGSYERRQEPSRRVISTPLGVKERAGLVEIRSGYAVPHNETEEEVRGVKDITSLDV